MSDIWFQHISSALSDCGLISYMWSAGDDRFQWAGDLPGLLGIQQRDYPQSSAQFHMLLNPQNVPGRLAALHGLLTRQANGMPVSMNAAYKMRRADGTYIDIEEAATLHIEEQTGRKTLCGSLRRAQAKPSAFDLSGSEQQEPVAFLEGGMVHHGRLGLQRRLEEWMHSGPEESGSHSYLLVVGINRLGLFNEAFGTRYADEVIEKTGQRLQKIVGQAGHVARIGGDVFGIFFEKAPYNEMASVAGYILGNFQETALMTTRGPAAVGVSVGGVTMNRQEREDAATVLTRAEIAMQAAKERGRNCFVSYKDASQQNGKTRNILESGNAFLQALKENRVRLAYQPIMHAQKGRVSFHEGLIRYIDESGKVHSAGQFIPAVERLGLGQLVDQFALKTAIAELTMFPDLSLSINVSNLSLTHQDWLRGLVASLRDRPSVARRLVIEITENTMMGDLDRTLRVVRTLQDLGCRVALDDFGAGYTAFSQLRSLNVDIVKIDKSFVRNLDENHNHLFVRTLQALAEGIDVETVGEGAETAAEAKILADDGIDHIQGYVYGFPQTERIWLPKDHIYRRGTPEISGKSQKAPTSEQSPAQQQIADEITAIARR